MEQLVYTWIVFTVSIAFLYFFLFTILSSRAKNKIVMYFIFLILTVAQAFLTRTVLKLPIPVYSTISSVVMLLFFLFGFTDSLKRKLVVYFYCFFMLLLLEPVATFLTLTILDVSYYDFMHKGEGLVVANVISQMLTCIVMMLFIVVDKHFKKRIAWKDLLLFLLILFSQLLLAIVFYKSCEHYTGIVAMLGTAMIIFGALLNMYMVHSLNTLISRVVAEDRLARYYEQRQTELDFYALVEENIRNMQEQRHDFMNHLQTAYEVFERGEVEKANELLGQITAKLREGQVHIFCEHPIVNAVLNRKNRQAANAGIPMNIETNIPEKLAVEEIDMCSIFSNLLDNAIEASKAYLEKGGKEPIINVRSNRKAGCLVIKVENIADSEHISMVESTSKEDKKNHGIGLSLVKKLAEKYSGSIEYCNEGEQFVVVVVLRVE